MKDVNADGKDFVNGVSSPQNGSLLYLDGLNRIADALERQCLLLADILSQNSAILESIAGEEQDAEPSRYMDGSMRGPG